MSREDSPEGTAQKLILSMDVLEPEQAERIADRETKTIERRAQREQ